MRSIFVSLIAWLTIVAATADEKTGMIYSSADIRAIKVSGLKLGMSEDEAKAILTASEFQGSFAPFQGTDYSVKPWTHSDSAILTYRFRAADGKNRLWQISLKQKFEIPQPIAASKASMIALHGQPTITEVGAAGAVYRLKYLTEHPVTEPCRSDNTPDCQIAASDTTTKDILEPNLQILITPKDIVITLMDRSVLRTTEKSSEPAQLTSPKKQSFADVPGKSSL